MEAMEALLKRIGWSERSFADRIGVDEQTVHDWKSGRRQGSSYRVAMFYLELVAIEYQAATAKNNGIRGNSPPY